VEISEKCVSRRSGSMVACQLRLANFLKKGLPIRSYRSFCKIVSNESKLTWLFPSKRFQEFSLSGEADRPQKGRYREVLSNVGSRVVRLRIVLVLWGQRLSWCILYIRFCKTQIWRLQQLNWIIEKILTGIPEAIWWLQGKIGPLCVAKDIARKIRLGESQEEMWSEESFWKILWKKLAPLINLTEGCEGKISS